MNVSIKLEYIYNDVKISEYCIKITQNLSVNMIVYVYVHVHVWNGNQKT